jgi:Uncharacterized protein conserved in bacteria (DUF2188)
LIKWFLTREFYQIIASTQTRLAFYKETNYMSRKSHHIVPSANGCWNVQKGGATRASIHTNTKQEAIDSGRQISRNQGSELVIHGRNGVIQRSDSHGNDPCPPKDSK